ncbi:hypothetical protein PLESTB_000486000 [Pleodorina starrii]|uniref:Rieske domain-containing protein n=1 Tax=Pleodorina starrii TaxID=330485 RepID=A0A9W6F0F4_9CHLO|nr:hypothetical protein PLESTM_000357200 [Pleodorina starrii]GLC51285.1 hypothetical protein PLESTB_000486000 [Pleodorina starrii]GLC63645.1 hypothetical protein PLESTF_000058900 [Pleodorina starrii]
MATLRPCAVHRSRYRTLPGGGRNGLPLRISLSPGQPPSFALRATAGTNGALATSPPPFPDARRAEPNGGDVSRSVASVTTTPAPTLEQTQPSPLWLRTWAPVLPTAQLDPSVPTPVVLLGQPLVVWRHSVRGWVVMRDVCPHRLAPLSEGRLEAGGTRLACSYHGWEFSEEGRCTKVPQLASNPRASATACASKRSCVTSFPTLELDGMLFAWLDASEEGLQAAQTAPKPELLEAGVTLIVDWVVNEMPVDYQFWMEQGQDPSHANYLHHGVAFFRLENSVPMLGKPVGAPDLLQGYRWEHGAYEKKQGDMRAVRDFRPPFNSSVVYPLPDGTATHFSMWVVPVRPGVCRTHSLIGTSKEPSKQQKQQQPAGAAANGAAANGAAANGTAANGTAANGTAANGTAANGAAANGTAANGTAANGAAANGTAANGTAANGAAANGAAANGAAANGAAANGGAAAAPLPAESKSAGGASQAATEAGGKGSGGPIAWLFGLLRRLPHWMLISQLVVDQDLMMMARQETHMRRTGQSGRDYNLNSMSDAGVAATHAWLRLADYPNSLWGGKPVVQSGPTYSGWPAQELSLEQILSRQERHVRHCTVCQRGLRQVTALCTALTVAAGLAAAAAVVLAVMAAVIPDAVNSVGGWRAVVGAVVVAAALALAAVKGWWYREEKFISGAAQWRRRGGFTLKGK